MTFTQYTPSEGLYEKDIENLLWNNLDDLLDTSVFRIARQPRLPDSGIPDILALDEAGRPIVVEVKRDLDRQQLAQVLEYAGWARSTNVQEVATLYSQGTDQFWGDWQEFTETDQPVPIATTPQVVLVAENFHERTRSALTYLRENGLPLVVLSVRIYEDSDNTRYLDVDREGRLDAAGQTVMNTRPLQPAITGPRRSFSVSVLDLLKAGMLRSGETLSWTRPRSGETHQITVEEDGRLQLSTGKIVSSLSTAATEVVGHGSFPGWECWHSESGERLYEMRSRLQSERETGTATT
ncbi:hypothetical protein [Dietzia kunjamensis]|uniref:restriction system modified-DNA reader domain-containing protein n=1 Tax=Dietzia kunjamensis TaxID=322509 RepID=UPI00336875A8